MALWLVASIYGAVAVLLALSVWIGFSRPKLAPLARSTVFTCVLLILAMHAVQVLSLGGAQPLEQFGLSDRFTQGILLGAPLVAMLVLIPSIAVLSGVARRAQKFHDASTALPGVMHRVTNLEMIYRLLMDCSLGATFVLTGAQGGTNKREAFRIIAGNRELKNLLELGVPDERRGAKLEHRDPDSISWWMEEIASKALKSNVPVRSERAFLIQGQTRWYLLSATGRGAYVAGVIMETTQKRRESTERAISANTDPLTKLSNRGHLTSMVNTETHRTNHAVSRGFVVYFFDFDGFKSINDTLGHHVGDELLKQIASRLRETFRRVSLPVNASRPCIARYGGDEFVVVVPGLTRRDDVDALAEAFLVDMREPYQIFGNEVRSTASIGGAVSTGQFVLGKDVLQAADEAMYQAKQSGKDRFCLHADSNSNPNPNPNPDSDSDSDSGERGAA